MPTYGTIKRVKPRLGVLRGFDPLEPRTRLAAYPVSTIDGTLATAPITIKSGQVISIKWNTTTLQNEWILGVTAKANGVVATPYIALDDSTDEDVIEAGKLPGLSCAGQFELRTGYYTAGTLTAHTNGVPLTFDGTTGNVKETTYGSGAPILGVVTRGIEDLSGKHSGATQLSTLVFETQFDANNDPKGDTGATGPAGPQGPAGA